MNPISWLFKILAHFNLMDPEDYAKNREEALAWWQNIRTDSEYEAAVKSGKLTEGAKKTPLPLLKLKAFFNNWYAQVGLSVSFIFVVRWVRDYMRGFRESELGDGQKEDDNF